MYVRFSVLDILGSIGACLLLLGPFHIGIYFKIFLRIRSLKIFLSKLSTFTLEIYFQKPYVNNMVDASESDDNIVI